MDSGDSPKMGRKASGAAFIAVQDGDTLCRAGETELQTHKPTDVDCVPPLTQHIQTLKLESFDVLLLTVSPN